jgi:DUF2075 family protein
MEWILIGIGVFVVIRVIVWVTDSVRKARLYDQRKPRLDKLDRLEADFKQEQANWTKKVQEDKQAIETLAKEKSLGFPWLAQAYADYFHLQDIETASYLEHKSHPATKAAETLRQIAAERRDAEKLVRVLKYQLEYYETLFPWLSEFKGEDLDDLVRQLSEDKGDASADGNEDPAKHWLTEAEYNSLTAAEKYQLALDRYWQNKKTKWELGRDYERYIGYLYESKGWQVRYQGIVEGFADLGRDLIATSDNTAWIIQCKYWSHHKTIHEKHIFQLYGTVCAYEIDYPGKKVSGGFVTSTALSDRARLFATKLGIIIWEKVALEGYPCVKCNFSRRNGEKIYHLPFDQQYDRTIIEEERNECYVATVKEAEALGFRRALRWRGDR